MPPAVGIWSWPQPAIVNGRKAVEAGNPESAAKQLKLAQEALRDARHAWNTYIDKTTGGAAKAVTALEFTRDISFSIAIGTAAVIAAPVVAGALAGGGAIGAGSAIGSGLIVTAGGGGAGAVLRGGSSAAGQALAGGSVNTEEVWKETKEGFKHGAVDAGSAVVGLGAGKALGVGAKGAGLGEKMVKSSLAGAASGGTGSAPEATIEGKSPEEILEAAGKGALAGTAGGAVGGVSSSLSSGKSAIAKMAIETAGEAGAGAATAAVSGGSLEDIKKAAVTSVIAGRATATAYHPASTKASLEEPTKQNQNVPENPAAEPAATPQKSPEPEFAS